MVFSYLLSWAIILAIRSCSVVGNVGVEQPLVLTLDRFKSLLDTG